MSIASHIALLKHQGHDVHDRLQNTLTVHRERILGDWAEVWGRLITLESLWFAMGPLQHYLMRGLIRRSLVRTGVAFDVLETERPLNLMHRTALL